MNAKTMKERLTKAGLTKKDGTLQVRYVATIKTNLARLAQGKRLHPKYWSKSRGRYELVDVEYGRIIDLLKALKVEYTTGNDAPKGGLGGDYIELTAAGRRVLNTCIKELIEFTK